MGQTEINIVEILPDDTNAGILKTSDGYVFRIRYRLEDGTIEPSTKTKRLLRDAKAEMASLPKVPEDTMAAIYRDGRCVGFRTTFYIGPRVTV